MLDTSTRYKTNILKPYNPCKINNSKNRYLTAYDIPYPWFKNNIL